jgi:hypothetical protein
MTTRRITATAITAAFACWLPGTAAPAAVRAIPSSLSGTATQQTNPLVHPDRGGPRTKFSLYLTARQRLGLNGGLRSDYRVTLNAAGGGCADAFTIDGGAAGARLHEGLHAPRAAGWCRGRYTGVVILDRAPSCAPAGPGAPPVACPDFLPAPVTVGHFHFTVV